jgi:hypothetical protein
MRGPSLSGFLVNIDALLPVVLASRRAVLTWIGATVIADDGAPILPAGGEREN